MTIYTLPSAKIKGVSGKFRLRPNSLLSVGSYTGTRSPYGPISNVWTAEISTAQMDRESWQYLSGFFARGQGQTALIRMTDIWRRFPLRDQQLIDANLVSTTFFNDATTFTDETGFVDGLLPPSVSVYEAAVAGDDSIVLTGFPASLSPALYLGDLFEVRIGQAPAPHGHLYEVAGNAPTDVNGRTRVYFVPELYAGVAAGDQVILREPMTLFRPASDEEGVIERFLADLGATGFTLIEERP